ncbi:putative Elicitor-responsive protein 3 [Cocos nucifera]|uniref:Putative Elicitor-responsive protein 3 n=1 Tax=Cocos nucifera TaxID=13894 RepID=A0A8K0HV36_COCNU|nr:putative Elicitor-responsive protein 3 [Cocos nucifera]
MSTVSGIQGRILEITVVGCSKLRDTELFSRQDPYVCFEYADSKFRTDGGRHPSFQEKFQIPLIEGLREINIIVRNSNTFSPDDFIGSGRVQLQKVLSQGYDDPSWPIQTRKLQ